MAKPAGKNGGLSGRSGAYGGRAQELLSKLRFKDTHPNQGESGIETRSGGVDPALQVL